MLTTPCPSCGHPNHDTARFCEECGTTLAAVEPTAAVTPPGGQPAVAPVPPASPAPPPAYATTGPGPAGASPYRNLLIGALVVLAGLALVLLVLLLQGGDDGNPSEEFDEVDTEDTLETSTTTTSTSSTTTTTTTTTPPEGGGGGGVLALPSGLFCRDLNAQGYSYADAVAYWDREGRPDRMDADLNGYPCETVYSSAEVTAYWGFDPQGGGGGGGGMQDLPAGLFCRDLNAMGYSYADAVGYWNVWGQPDRMDEDLNGYPCETVYPASDVIAYWGFDPP